MFSIVSVFEDEKWVVDDLCVVYSRVEADDPEHAAEIVAMVRDDYQDQNNIPLTGAGRETVGARVRVRWTEQPENSILFDWDSELSDYERAVAALEY
jgi:uncharacterized OB-fold protein